MRKNKNFFALVILLFIFSIQSFSQEKLNGKYSNLMKNQDSFNYITFNLDGTFNYESGGDLGERELYGSGEYKIENYFLILNYNKTKPVPMSFYKNEIWQNNNDSISLSVKVIDLKENKVIPNTNVFLKSDSKYIHNGLTDKNGVFSVKIKKDRKKVVKIIANEMFYNECTVDLRMNANYNLKFYLSRSGKGIPILNRVDTLKIKEIKSNRLKFYTKELKVEIWSKLKS